MSDQLQVRVRMYRQGFGDCFLLRFSPKGKPNEVLAHVLIDCGVDVSTPGGADLIRKVAADVQKETHGKLDVLVATHEHWDHVSGFLRAKDTFNALRIDNVWLGWTEDPEDSLAKSLNTERSLALSAAAFAAHRLERNGALTPGERKSLERIADGTGGVLSFFGKTAYGATKFSPETDKAMDYVSSRKKDHVYCRPGKDPLTVMSLPGIRFYILGPPHDKIRLMQTDPSASHPETYGVGRSHNATLAMASAVGDLGSRGGFESAPELLPPDEARRFRGYPFPEPAQIPETSPVARQVFAKTYFGDGREWRRIDYDWLTGATDLALQLDNATNNTSLVLAIELPETRRVLLFAADAQVGNWISWGDCSWTIRESTGEERQVSAEDLLRRTVLYKVGHHGSHNATLREKGLELMVATDLVAMMSVDERFAHKKKHWPIPHPRLTKRLLEKTRGRLLRVDKDWPTSTATKPAALTGDEWKAFMNNTDVKELWIDYVVT